MIRTIIFDFDGVICESVDIKSDAFYELYLPFGESIAKKVKAYHQANGGMSRFDKFRYFQKEYFGEKISTEQMEQLSSQFSSLVMQKVIQAPFVEGAKEFLETESSRYNCFIVSATPMDEMIAICEAKNILSYFKQVFGSPKDKNTWVSHILDSYKLNPDETIFIGDALSDYRAAQANHVHFLLRKTQENRLLFDSTVDAVDNLNTLADYLGSIR